MRVFLQKALKELSAGLGDNCSGVLDREEAVYFVPLGIAVTALQFFSENLVANLGHVCYSG